MGDEPLRVVIAEDEALLRRGLELMLTDAGMRIVGSVSDVDELIDAVGAARPELVITDIRMPPTYTDEGLRAAARIRELAPDTAIMVLSQHVQRRYAMELLGMDDDARVDLDAWPGTGIRGGTGYLLKQRITDVDLFVDDVRAVAAGGTAIDPDVVAIMVARATRADAAVAELTVRQREVLALVAQGRSNAAIAARLSITDKAVVQHISRIYDALGLPLAADAHRRVLAVLHYLSQDPQRLAT